MAVVVETKDRSEASSSLSAAMSGNAGTTANSSGVRGSEGDDEAPPLAGKKSIARKRARLLDKGKQSDSSAEKRRLVESALDQKRKASRESSRRSQERQKSRIAFLGKEKERLRNSNQALMEKNQKYREVKIALQQVILERLIEQNQANVAIAASVPAMMGQMLMNTIAQASGQSPALQQQSLQQQSLSSLTSPSTPQPPTLPLPFAQQQAQRQQPSSAMEQSQLLQMLMPMLLQMLMPMLLQQQAGDKGYAQSNIPGSIFSQIQEQGFMPMLGTNTHGQTPQNPYQQSSIASLLVTLNVSANPPTVQQPAMTPQPAPAPPGHMLRYPSGNREQSSTTASASASNDQQSPATQLSNLRELLQRTQQQQQLPSQAMEQPQPYAQLSQPSCLGQQQPQQQVAGNTAGDPIPQNILSLLASIAEQQQHIQPQRQDSGAQRRTTNQDHFNTDDSDEA